VVPRSANPPSLWDGGFLVSARRRGAIDIGDQWAVIGRITLAAVLGAVIGLEREYRGYPAGVRTMALVCMGSAIFADMSREYGGDDRIAVDRPRLLDGQPPHQFERRLAVEGRLVDTIRSDGAKRDAEHGDQLASPWRRGREGEGHAASRGIPAGSAQRIVRVTASPPARSTVASATGSHGNRSGHRAQRGSRETAAPASGRYRPRSVQGSGGLAIR